MRSYRIVQELLKLHEGKQIIIADYAWDAEYDSFAIVGGYYKSTNLWWFDVTPEDHTERVREGFYYTLSGNYGPYSD